MIVLRSFSYLITVLTFLPLVRDNYWIFRTLEYPRFQKMILVAAILLGWLGFFMAKGQIDWICVACLFASLIYLLVKIFPYTPVAKKEVSTLANADPNCSLKIFTANVYQYQTNFAGMLSQIEACDPDIVVLVETDLNWQKGVAVLMKKYPYHLLEPLDNTYGMLFFSRFEMSDASIKYLVKNDIPSLETKIHLPCGVRVQLYGLHPEPPVPGESLRSTAKDKELMKVAFKVRDCKIPCVVLGDLNDVAWSYTTSLFTKVSQLLDVRCGRGFYSTFSAKSRLIRFPLDYIFCSSDFGLYAMKRLDAAGSDHFPIFTHLVYRPDLNKEQEKDEKASQKDLSDAQEMRVES